jgi:hypothetical protein
MEFVVELEGAEKKEHWTTCQGRAVLGVSVRWKPTDEHADQQPPHCSLAYVTAPGSLPSGLPDKIALIRENGEWVGRESFEAPSFTPLRIRVELRPAFERPQVVVLHVIPRVSAWIASGLVAASLGLAAILLAMTLTTLRMTLTQATGALSSVALLSAALFVLKRALMALRPDHLPFLGVTFLIQRSLLACGAGFLMLFVVLQSCFVVIDNDTGRQVTLGLPWLDGDTYIAPNARITVVPNSDALRTDLLSFLASEDASLPLCVHDGGDPVQQKTPCRDDDSYVPPTLGVRVSGWFTPPTLQLRCGHRWAGLTRERIVGAAPPGVKLADDGVWIEPEKDSTCGEREVELWYRHDDGGVHHVRYPWQPDALARATKLFIDRVTPPARVAQPSAVTLATRADPSELRIPLTSSHADEGRSFALVGDPKVAPLPLTLEIGDPLAHITDPFAAAATLACEHAPGGSTVFRATQLAVAGRNGWLAELTTRSPQGLSSSSAWKLIRGASPAVATPWMCEVLPGDDPGHSKHVAFTPEQLTIVVEEGADEPSGQRIFLPARLMSRRVEIKRRQLGQVESQLVGRLDCGLKASEDELLAVGAVHFEDHRQGKFRRFRVDTDQKEPLHWSAEAPARPDGKVAAWLCWRAGAGEDEVVKVEVTLDGEQKSVTGDWKVAEARLTLQPQGAVTCYLGPDLEPLLKLPKGHKKIGKPSKGAELVQTLPAVKHCHTVWRIEKKQDSP